MNIVSEDTEGVVYNPNQETLGDEPFVEQPPADRLVHAITHSASPVLGDMN